MVQETKIQRIIRDKVTSLGDYSQLIISLESCKRENISSIRTEEDRLDSWFAFTEVYKSPNPKKIRERISQQFLSMLPAEICYYCLNEGKISYIGIRP